MAKEKDPKKIKTSIYLPPDLFWKLKELTVSKRLPTDNEAMEEAVRQWVERESKPSGDTPKAKQAERRRRIEQQTPDRQKHG